MGWGWGDTGLGFGVGAASPVGSPGSPSHTRASRSWMLPAGPSTAQPCPALPHAEVQPQAPFYVCCCTAPARGCGPGLMFSPPFQQQTSADSAQRAAGRGKTTRRHVAGARRACSTATWPGTPALPTAEGFWGGSVAPHSPHALLHPASPVVLAPHTPSRCASFAPAQPHSIPRETWQRMFYWHLRIVPATGEPARPGQGLGQGSCPPCGCGELFPRGPPAPVLEPPRWALPGEGQRAQMQRPGAGAKSIVGCPALSPSAGA